MTSLYSHVHNAVQRPGKARTLGFVLVAGWFLFALASLSVGGLYFFGFVAATLVLLLFVFFPTMPIYVMAATYPMTNLQLVYGPINTPVVDVFAAIAVAAWILRVGASWMTGESHPRNIDWWGLPIWGAWVGLAILSTAFSWEIIERIRFTIRPLAFFYLAYVLVPLNTIRTKEMLVRLLWILYGLGVVIATYGFYGFAASLRNPNIPRRVVPIDILGYAPIGTNHSIIAQVMLVSIPIGLYLLYRVHDVRKQQFVFLGMLFMSAALVFTFSRTGWLGLGLEMIIFAVLQHREKLRQAVRYMFGLFLIALPVVLYMLYFSFATDTVQSSNENRLLLNDVALEMFVESPIWGAGPGTFMHRLGLNKIYVQEFGTPIDSHGFIQKVGSELGVLGLLIYIGFLAYVLYTLANAWREDKKHMENSLLLLAMILLVSGSIFAQLFQTSYYIAEFWVPMGIAVAAARILNTQTKRT